MESWVLGRLLETHLRVPSLWPLAAQTLDSLDVSFDVHSDSQKDVRELAKTVPNRIRHLNVVAVEARGLDELALLIRGSPRLSSVSVTFGYLYSHSDSSQPLQAEALEFLSACILHPSMRRLELRGPLAKHASIVCKLLRHRARAGLERLWEISLEPVRWGAFPVATFASDLPRPAVRRLTLRLTLLPTCSITRFSGLDVRVFATRRDRSFERSFLGMPEAGRNFWSRRVTLGGRWIEGARVPKRLLSTDFWRFDWHRLHTFLPLPDEAPQTARLSHLHSYTRICAPLMTPAIQTLLSNLVCLVVPALELDGPLPCPRLAHLRVFWGPIRSALFRDLDELRCLELLRPKPLDADAWSAVAALPRLERLVFGSPSDEAIEAGVERLGASQTLSELAVSFDLPTRVLADANWLPKLGYVWLGPQTKPSAIERWKEFCLARRRIPISTPQGTRNWSPEIRLPDPVRESRSVTSWRRSESAAWFDCDCGFPCRWASSEKHSSLFERCCRRVPERVLDELPETLSTEARDRLTGHLFFERNRRQ